MHIYSEDNSIIIHFNFPLTAVSTSWSEVTVMQSDDNQPKQDDESSQVTYTEG